MSSQQQIPYQCLKKYETTLIAARGSSIDLFNLEDHLLLSTWKCPSEPEPEPGFSLSVPETSMKPAPQESKSNADIISNTDASTPQAKRRKLSNAAHSPKTSETNGQRKANNRSDAVASGLQAPAVIALAVARGGKHVIAVTGEDKSIRVFEDVSGPNGGHQLQQISQRTMPKRPCALAIMEDDSTIITADKFGDVYSLPLLISEVKEKTEPESPLQKSETGGGKPFIPAANNLTVHSQRNLKALQNQKRQTNKQSEKTGPSFEYKLLLGHVSMLTDTVFGILEGRNYIITADRDEHIRVSRGIPQAHIIEGFCLGHTEFISRLCIPKDRPEVLISGGGDDDLFVWNWASGKLASQSDLRSRVQTAMSQLSGRSKHEDMGRSTVAVSGITHINLRSKQDMIVVTCESAPILFLYLLTSSNTLEFVQSVQLEGNALSVVAHSSKNNDFLIISVDCIHKSGSITECTDRGDIMINPLQSYKFQDQQLIPVSTFEIVDHQEENDKAIGTGRLTNLLYGLENLRKRDGDVKDED